MKRRVVLSSPKVREMKKKRRTAQARRAVLFVLAFLALFAGLIFLSRWEKLNVSGISVTGVSQADADMVKEEISKDISGKYIFFFPKSNILLLPEGSMKEDLGREFKRFKDIDMDLQGSVLNVALSEREARYLWCGEAYYPGEEISKCYFTDQSGYIFDEAPYFSGDVYFKLFGKLKEKQEIQGSYFLPGIFERIASFKDSLSAIGVKPLSLYAKDDGDMEFLLPAGRILFKPEEDLVKLVENLDAALSTEPLRTEFKEKNASLEYIDLRFGNKVYYKFR